MMKTMRTAKPKPPQTPSRAMRMRAKATEKGNQQREAGCLLQEASDAEAQRHEGEAQRAEEGGEDREAEGGVAGARRPATRRTNSRGGGRTVRATFPSTTGRSASSRREAAASLLLADHQSAW